MSVALLFAGQGSQEHGMGHDFYNQFSNAKEIYDLYPEIRDLCFYDSDNKLN